MTRLCRGCGKRIWWWQRAGKFSWHDLHVFCLRVFMRGWHEPFGKEQFQEALVGILKTGGGQGPGAQLQGNAELSIAPARGSSESKADLLMRVGWEEFLRLCKEAGP